MAPFALPQTWLTYATRPEHVSLASVLAKSLRRTLTTRRIGVITSVSLSAKERSQLRQCFDDVFLVDTKNERMGCDLEPGKNGLSDIGEENYAKIFAFTLDIFDKVVLLEPNSFFLENGDHLFSQGQAIVMSLMRDTGGAGVPADFFVLKPCKHFAEFLELKLATQTGVGKGSNFGKWLVKHAKSWVQNNRLNAKWEETSRDSVAQLSLETAVLLNRNCWAPPTIVQMIGAQFQQKQVEALLSQGQLGITERAILSVWLKLHTGDSGHSLKPEAGNEPIAIVGISCRLPGANNLEEFWKLLYAGEESVREPPQFRWRKEHVVTRVGEKERQTRAGFLAATVDEFDAKFFGVSPKEAEFMDPQTRLMHEVMWESLENAGVDPSSLNGSNTGIFTGSWMNNYKEIVDNSVTRDFFRNYMGNGIGAAAARLSFLLGTTGPCIATESACSSGIVTVDMAVKCLRSGESDLALAGGVNLLLHPFTSQIMDYVISPDGRCKTFDANANGFARAEGCGFLVLKRLSDAMKDRDHIWGLIRGSAVSQEGISRSLGTPTIHCEALAMELALEDGGVRPEQVSFVETHGTGTAVGDPMEVAAIAKAYHVENRKEPMVIGSVKTNVGHTESVSGITGIIKTVLAMKHELIPKHLNLETLNPEINLHSIPARIPLEPIAWPKAPGQPRFAGVSSFGITGTDGHLILQEAPDTRLPKFVTGVERPLHILKISARSKDAMEEVLQRYVGMFSHQTSDRLEDVAYTGNVGRADFELKTFILGSDFSTAASFIEGSKMVRGEVKDHTGKICFLFTGQGSQYSGMGKSLYDSSPVFQFHFDQCDSLLRKKYNVDIRKVLWGNDENLKEISRTIFSQTGIFVVEYCLLQLWRSWGLKPDVVLGHSLGEFCAAVAAGVLTFKDALKLVAERSRLIDNLPRGSMLVLKTSKPEVEKLMKKAHVDLDFAALNSPEQTVVAGDTDKVEKLLAFCKEKGVKGVILEASHAFHSHHMDPMLEEYKATAEGIQYREATECQYISGMEGVVKEKLDADYWVRHTREKVNFLGACNTLQTSEVEHFLEVGPHPVLSAFVLQNVEQQVACLPSLRKKTDEWETMLSSLGKLWVAGYKVDWEEFDKPYDRRKVDTLPFYPFQRKSYWVDVNEMPPPSIHPLVGAQLSNASNLSIYQNDLSVATVPYLKDHCIGNKIVFPGACFTEMCLTAGYAVSNFLKDRLAKPRQPVALENVRIETPLELKEDKSTRLQVIVDLPEVGKQAGGAAVFTANQQSFRCKVFHRNVTETEMGGNENWVAHATAEFYPVVGGAQEMLQKQWNGNRVKEMVALNEGMSLDAFYNRIDSVGLKFGETFRSIQRSWHVTQKELDLNEVVVEVKVPVEMDKYLLHPLLIDAMFQAQILAGIRENRKEVLMVPVKIGRLVLFGTIPEMGGGDSQVAYIHAKWTDKDRCALWLCTQNFQPVALMEQVELLETNVKTIRSMLENQSTPIPDCWEEVWKPIPGITDDRVVLEPLLKEATNSSEYLKNMASASNVTADDYVQNEMVSRLVTLYSYQALWKLGWRPKSRDELSAEEFCSQFGVKVEYLRQLIYFYFGCFRDELKLMELLEDGKTWRVCQVPVPTEEEITQQLKALYDKCQNSEKIEVVTRIYENVAKHLPKVLTSEENPLSILFPVDPSQQHLSVANYYQHHPGREDVASKLLTSVRNWLEGVRAKTGNQSDQRVLRVLEVGGGTASMSLLALKQFTNSWGPKLEYYFTDISASFFVKAEKLLEEYRSQVKFAVFNIEEHPLSQGIPLNYFDLVVATDVLHATRELAESVANLRLTLRPGGYLLFTETVCADKGITSVFGLLEGYWRFQDFERRPHHACVGLETWRQVLQENGFDFVHTLEAYTGTFGIIVGEATGAKGYDVHSELRDARGGLRKAGGRHKWVVFATEDQKAIRKLANVLQETGRKVELVYPTLELVKDLDAQGVYEILKSNEGEEVEGVIYAWGMGMTSGEINQSKVALPFLHIAKQITSAEKPPRLYVLTKGVHAITDEETSPDPVTLWGMAKSLKNENSDLFVRCVDLSSAGDWGTEVDQLLYEVAMWKEKERIQVCYREGKRWEPKLNRVQIPPSAKSDLQLPPSTERYQLALPETRVMQDLEFRALEEEPVGEGDVEVKCHAYALNFKDILTILKPSAEFEKLNTVGLDFAGEVTRVAPGETKWRVGDRVFGVNAKDAQLPSHMVTSSNALLKIPKTMTFAEASTLSVGLSTSIHCLFDYAQLKKGDTVLIHTGSGGVGLSAIQLAKHVGAEIITTAGSPRKRAYLRSLGIEHVFHSRDTSYQQDILRVTNGRGVDVVLNSITGPGFKEASLAVCAKNARFVEMSKLSVWTPEEVKERRPWVLGCGLDLFGGSWLENTSGKIFRVFGKGCCV